MTGRISERDIDYLRTCMALVLSILFGVTDLRRSFRCPLPGHDDSDPSAHFYADNNTVHCYGCGETVDVFGLVGAHFGIASFPEQVQKVAEISDYSLSGDDGPPRPRPKPKPRPPFDPPRKAGGQDCYEACGRAFGDLYAPGNEVGRRYLRYRGLDDDDAAKWALGFTREPWKVHPNFRLREPDALGFITIPFFTGPDFDAVNYVMVRTISRGQVRNKEWRPKGVPSPLWNEWMLSASRPVVYVTEGLIDAMALAKVVDGDVMALGGVANAKRFSQVLYHAVPESRPEKVIVCMDEDAEGRKARDKMCADLKRIGVAHNAMPPYPGGAKDADEWLMAGKGVDWEFEERAAPPMDGPLYRTRWLR